MDEMVLRSTFIQGIASKIIKKIIKRKTGCDPDLKFNDPIKLSFDGSVVKLHLNIDATLSKDSLELLIKDLI